MSILESINTIDNSYEPDAAALIIIPPQNPSQAKPAMPSPTFEVQSYRGISLGWVAVGQRYHSQAMAERLLTIRCRVDPWRYCYRVAQVG